MYKVRLLADAEGQLKDLDKTIQKRVVKKLNWLAENLDDFQQEALAADLAGLFKLRVGDYRVVYQLAKSDIIVHVIGHRRDVYEPP